MEWLRNLFSSGHFMPHGFCYLWNSGLVWLHVVSDSLIALAYFSIPITLVYFVRKRRDLPFHWMFLLFGLFIVACGSTHAMEVWTLWHATYWLSGIVKAITALASVPTAILLVQLVPDALKLPSPERLALMNQELVSRTNDLARTNAELAAANQALQLSEDRYRLLFDSNPHPVWVYDLETLAFLDVNRSAVQNYGYPKEEFLSRTIKDIRPPEDIPALLESVSTAPASAETAGVWRHRKKDGTLITVEVTSHPVTVHGRNARFVVATDVTERKKAEEALRLSEERFSSAFEYAAIGMALVSPSGRWLKVNRALCQIVGYSSDELLERTFQDITHPDDLETDLEYVHQMLADEIPAYQMEKRYVHKDGHFVWVLLSVSLVRGQQSQEGYFISQIQDITKRKRVEEALQASEEKFRTLAETANDAILSANSHGTISYFNHAAEEMFGYSSDEVVGQPLTLLMPERFRDSHAQGFERFLRTGEARVIGKTVEMAGLRKDGSEFPVEISLSTWKMRTEIFFSAILSDISQRKKAEQKFKALLESAPDAMIIVNRGGRIELINAQTEKLFGYTRQELLGECVDMLVPERFQSKHGGHRQGFFHAPETRGMGAGLELYALRKDGTEFPAEISFNPLEIEEGVLVSSAIRDITDRKKVEEAIERQRNELARSNAELTAANRELEAFSYSVSHDLRAPLRSIDGFSLALLEDYADKLDIEGRDNLQRVRAATQRMGTLIDDLLSLARVARAEIKLEGVDLSEIVRSIAVSLQNTELGRRTEFHIQGGLEATVDARLIRIAFENLLGNAWKFTSKRNPAIIEFGRSQNSGPSAFFIRDNGAGFEPAHASRLFGAFQRLHDNREFPGTGVGLATVQRIVLRHGGRIWGEGAVDKGASFYFTLWETRPSEA